MSDISEISISKVRGDQYWDIWVSDGTEANKLANRGWEIEWDNTKGGYVHCKIPLKALTIRTKKAVENLAKRSEEMKGKGFPSGKSLNGTH